MDNIKIGNRIKKRRTQLNLTLQEIANTINVHKSTIQRYESGSIKDIKYPVLDAIAEALDVNPLWLRGEIDTMEHSEEYERITYLTNTYFKSVMKWTQDSYLNEQETTIIREHFSDLLLKYKSTIEHLVDAKRHWNNSKESYNDIFRNRENPLSDEEIKELFLKQELERDLNNVTCWVNALPNWIARKENELINHSSENDKAYLIPIAAHDKCGNFSKEDIEHDNGIMNNDNEW